MKIRSASILSKLPGVLLTLVITTFSLIGLSGAALAQNWSDSGNNVQLGNEIVVPAGTVTNGDVVAIFDDVTVIGEVRGDAVAVGGDVIINGKVSGDVVSVGGRVTLGETALVNGEVTIVGAGLDKAPTAKILGNVNNIGIGDFFRNPRVNLSGIRWFGFANPIGYLFYLLGLYALTLLTVSLFPSNVAGVTSYMEKEWGRSAMVGALALLLIAPVTLLVAITVIGIPLAMLLWIGFFLAKMLGYVAAVSLLGSRVGGEATASNHLARLALGVLILGLVRYVPLIGALASLAVTIVTLGAVIDSKFGTNKPWLPRRKA